MKAFESSDELAAFEGVAQEFSLRGVEFKAKPIMSHADFGALTALGSGQENAAGIVAGVVRNTLLPDYRQAWDELLARELEIPISFGTLTDVANFLAEGATGRPPQSPSPSGNSGANRETSLTDGSASLVDPASILSQSVPSST